MLTNQPALLRARQPFPHPPDTVFAYLTDTDALSQWIPFIRSSHSDDSRADAPQGVGSVRVIDKGVGEPVRELIKLREPPEVFAYSARDQDFFGLVLDHLSVIAIEKTPEGCLVHWVAYGRVPGPLRGFIGRLLLGFVFRVGLWRGRRRLG